MAKFLVYCYECDEEYETNDKRGRCRHCGSRSLQIDDIGPKPVREGRRDWMENSPRRQF